MPRWLRSPSCSSTPAPASTPSGAGSPPTDGTIRVEGTAELTAPYLPGRRRPGDDRTRRHPDMDGHPQNCGHTQRLPQNRVRRRPPATRSGSACTSSTTRLTTKSPGTRSSPTSTPPAATPSAPRTTPTAAARSVYHASEDFTLFGRSGARTALSEPGDITVNVTVNTLAGLSDDLEVIVFHGHGDDTPVEYHLPKVAQGTIGSFQRLGRT